MEVGAKLLLLVPLVPLKVICIQLTIISQLMQLWTSYRSIMSLELFWPVQTLAKNIIKTLRLWEQYQTIESKNRITWKYCNAFDKYTTMSKLKTGETMGATK